MTVKKNENSALAEGLKKYEEIADFIKARFEWIKTDSEVRKFDGTIVSSIKDVEAPKNWSASAINIVAQKYMRKTKVPVSLIKVRNKDDKNVPDWLLPSIAAEGSEETRETSILQTVMRLAGTWTYWGVKGGHIHPGDAEAHLISIAEDILNQLAMPNSPQWFNTGIHWAYGIKGSPKENWRATEVGGEAKLVENYYENPQVHACFLNSVEDKISGEGGIIDLIAREAIIFSGGSGSGANFSHVRSKYEEISNGGMSSGLLSFLRVGDASAGAIKSGGTTRRAAKMVVVDIDHPEVDDFIDWKVKEENKVADLVTGSKINAVCVKEIYDEAKINPDIATNQNLRSVIAQAMKYKCPNGLIDKAIKLAQMGYEMPVIDTFDTDWQSEAYATVNGQNSNNTVSIPNAFMTALSVGEDWSLTRRLDGKVQRTVNSQYLWDKITNAAWQSADPGVHYKDIINDWHTIPEAGPIRTSNPCSEYMSIDDTGCNLASLNVMKFYNPKTKNFDIDTYIDTCRRWTKILEISVFMAQLPSRKIAENTAKYRQLGLGFANVGALAMMLGLPYDSDKARTAIGLLISIMTATAYNESALMARDLGPFYQYHEKNSRMIEVIFNHAKAAGNFTNEPYKGVSVKPVELSKSVSDTLPSGLGRLYEISRKAWNEAYENGKKHGYRNSQVTAIAPTGTIGLAMDCDTTGIEPDYAIIKYKSLAGGGSMMIVNSSVQPALENLGYGENAIAEIMEYIQKNNGIDDCEAIKEEHLAVFDCASPARADGRAIDWSGHIKMLAATQPFVSGSTSKTVNMPSSVTIEDCSDAFKMAHKLGVKAVAIYRNESKLSQPLTSTSEISKISVEESEANQAKPQVSNEEQIQRLHDLSQQLIRRARERRKLPGRRNGHIQKFSFSGHKIYLHTGEYENGKLGEIFIDTHKEGAAFRALMNNFAIAVSLGLQYGVPLIEFVDAFTYTNFEPNGPVQGHNNIKLSSSILDAIFRHLAIEYLQMDEFANVKPDRTKKVEVKNTSTDEVNINKIIDESVDLRSLSEDDALQENKSGVTTNYEKAKNQGFTGSQCTNCGSMKMIRTGTCEMCTNCNTSAGGCG